MTRHPLPSMLLEGQALKNLATPNLFAGVTTPQIRRDRVRAELLSRGLAEQPSGVVIAKRQYTWAQVFERLYGTPLIEPKGQQVLL